MKNNCIIWGCLHVRQNLARGKTGMPCVQCSCQWTKTDLSAPSHETSPVAFRWRCQSRVDGHV